ncbi:CST complex subunit STN1-like isoform X1 [Haliotis rufescens]|uniref:CST complex subunit STN1-like isoform X1 n=1 Tax=Haliotis rufescens TaxID=6454 RepID=UPI00201E8BF5|nr:CST complex subunit STN1-like isoform X1 [Haliotis rufescens]
MHLRFHTLIICGYQCFLKSDQWPTQNTGLNSSRSLNIMSNTKEYSGLFCHGTTEIIILCFQCRVSLLDDFATIDTIRETHKTLEANLQQKLFLAWPDDDIRVMDVRGDETMYSTLPVSLQKKVCDIQDEEKQATSGYSHGDLVHIKGKVKVFREVNEITALYHAKVDNPAAEIVRMVELPKLYKMCYDKPFELPHRVRADLDMAREEDTTGVKSCKRILQEVGVAVSEHLRTAPSVREFTASQMCRLATVTAILAQQQSLDEKQSPISMVTQALKKLEEEAGTVCRRMEASALYENLNHSRALKEAILNVLVKESQKPKYSERGCHYLHILDELHRTAQYSKLHQTALLHCLQALETQSDVIRTYHKQYLPCVT